MNAWHWCAASRTALRWPNSAKTGFVTAHDAFGRTLASNSTFAEDPAMVVADVPLGPGTTPYSRFGDWFGWLCVAATLGILMMVLMSSSIRQR